jgi:putative DNA methylase
MTVTKIPKKLIEVALPLDDINAAASREKAVRQGHPSSLHLWWARRPLAAARAVLFAQMVNDPGYERGLGRGVNKERAQVERERLFQIIRKLVKNDGHDDESVLAEARSEIVKSWHETCELNRNHPEASELFCPEKLPAFHDPFAGGGAIPLEAQRLGLESHASDLNPIAVLINKAMIEIPPRFAGSAAIGPRLVSQRQREFASEWRGSAGLAEDVRRYGYWLKEEALKKIGSLYPNVKLPREYGGGEGVVIAWLWARTVKSPNPAFSNVDVPLVTNFIISSKVGKEAWVDAVLEKDGYRFVVQNSKPPENAKAGTKAPGRGANFICLLSGTPISGDYIKSEGQAGRIGTKLMAVVVEGKRGRHYLSPTIEAESVAKGVRSDWRPSGEVPARLTGGTCVPYGLREWGDLFTARQLNTLNTFSQLIGVLRQKVERDASEAGFSAEGKRLLDGGSGAAAYADSICILLAFCIDKMADLGNSLVRWEPIAQCPRQLFGRQSIPMIWDFAEANPFSESSGSWQVFVEGFAKAYAQSFSSSKKWFRGFVSQHDAQRQQISLNKVVSTDPPYYDNIAYADLSDFFYVWARRSLREILPDLFATMAVPKSEELVAAAYRHGGKEAAEEFFLKGMTQAMHSIAEQAHPAFPTTIYYAFKQSDTSELGTVSTGWETFLEAVIRAGFSIGGTWPMRTENASRMVGQGTNALASSIILVCRKRDASAPTCSRRDFLRELKSELADAVEVMIGGVEGISPVAPVDLAQAVIGPGMAIFSKYSEVLEADGSPMTVHTALSIINRMLTEGSDDFDSDTQFCLGWFDEQGWTAGDFGKADVLSRAKGTSVDNVKNAGVVTAIGGKVRLVKPVEYPSDWNPKEDNNTPVWEALHQMIRALKSQGESAAGVLLARMPERAERIRGLAYRLYTLCERKGWADDARGYNELITSWQGIEIASHDEGHVGTQTKLDI